LTALTNGGGYAESCATDAQHCRPIPKGVTVRDAAGLPETFFTVWSKVFTPIPRPQQRRNRHRQKRSNRD